MLKAPWQLGMFVRVSTVTVEILQREKRLLTRDSGQEGASDSQGAATTDLRLYSSHPPPLALNTPHLPPPRRPLLILETTFPRNPHV